MNNKIIITILVVIIVILSYLLSFFKANPSEESCIEYINTVQAIDLDEDEIKEIEYQQYLKANTK